MMKQQTFCRNCGTEIKFSFNQRTGRWVKMELDGDRRHKCENKPKSATCRHCGGTIIWHQTPRGKWVPAEPGPDGNVQFGGNFCGDRGPSGLVAIHQCREHMTDDEIRNQIDVLRSEIDPDNQVDWLAGPSEHEIALVRSEIKKLESILDQRYS